MTKLHVTYANCNGFKLCTYLSQPSANAHLVKPLSVTHFAKFDELGSKKYIVDTFVSSTFLAPNSVTRRLDYLFNIWPFKAMKIGQRIGLFGRGRLKILSNTG